MKMQKRVLTFLMALMMVLGLAACGGGGASAAGVYKITKMSSEGIEMTTEEMSELFGMEVDMTLELKDDNTFVLDLGFLMGEGEEGTSGTWELDGDALTLSADGEDITTTYDGKTIVLEEGTEILTFEKQ
ncbi:lipocalin family protein [Anaerotignum sp.]|uniref:lipocalin family protein n=1 Tax=Anaerotignum sp. TaxID=2039241 RepID=UPI0027B985E6|nr:lipocalin family protein [Anaerotignum sp.]